MLGQESGRTNVSRIFRIFVPNFAPNFAPNFPRIFRGLFVLRFVGDGDQKKIHQKSPPFFNAEFPGKHEKNIHKILLESRQSEKMQSLFVVMFFLRAESQKFKQENWSKMLWPSGSKIQIMQSMFRKRAEYNFGEHCFKHRTQ